MRIKELSTSAPRIFNQMFRNKGQECMPLRGSRGETVEIFDPIERSTRPGLLA